MTKGTPTGSTGGGAGGTVNQAPVANAGNGQAVVYGGVVQLDGSASYDPDGDAFTYQWSQISGATVTLSDATIASPTFQAPEFETSLTFRLVVTDTHGATGAASVIVYVNEDGTFPPFDPGTTNSSSSGGCVAVHGGGAGLAIFGLLAAAARRRRK